MPSIALLLLVLLTQSASSEGLADRGYKRVSNSLQATADWIDNIFLDERTEQENAWSRLIVRLDNEWIESEGVSNDIALRGKIVLPSLDRRIRLIFEDEADPNNPEAFRDGDNNRSAIRILLNDSLRERLNFDVGARGGLSNPRLFTRLQYRYQIERDRHNYRFRPTIIWDTDRAWEAYVQFDYEQRFREQYFLRSRTTPKVFDTEPGWEIEQNFTLFRDLGNDRFLALEWQTDLKEGPDFRIDGSYLRMRFRHDLWKQRLFLEVGPGMRIVDDNDLRPQLDGYLRFELLLTSANYQQDKNRDKSGSARRDTEKPHPSQR